MEILAPILSKCPIVIANLTPNECFSHAGHIIYHEGQQFIYPLLHVFVRFLGSGFVYIEDQPDPVPKPLFWVHQAVERLRPLVEVFVALHEEAPNLFKQFGWLHLMFMHVHQNVALDDLERVVERMRIPFRDLVHLLSNDGRLRSIYDCDDLVNPPEEDPGWRVLRLLLKFFFDYFGSSLADNVQ
jgi:hypothetical protein